MSNQNNRDDQERGKGSRRERVHHAGYSPVLIQSHLKDRLRDFRQSSGLGYDTHIERCLVSAAVQMLLDRSDLRDQWLQVLGDAVKQDVLLTTAPQVRGTGSAVYRHAGPGTDSLE